MPKPRLSMPEQMLTDQEAAARLGVSVSTVQRLRRDGDLAFVRIRHSVRIADSEVVRYLNDNAS